LVVDLPGGEKLFALLPAQPRVDANEPRLVRFGDLSRPDTVEFVDPKRLDESFGPGIVLKAVHHRRTDDEITQNVESVLPWLPQYKNRMFDGFPYHRSSGAVAGQLGYSDFREIRPDYAQEHRRGPGNGDMERRHADQIDPRDYD
jgi:hypothetical protein